MSCLPLGGGALLGLTSKHLAQSSQALLERWASLQQKAKDGLRDLVRLEDCPDWEGGHFMCPNEWSALAPGTFRKVSLMLSHHILE